MARFQDWGLGGGSRAPPGGPDLAAAAAVPTMLAWPRLGSRGGGGSKMAQTIFEALEGERRRCRGKRLFRVAPPPAAPSQRGAQGARRPRGGGRRGRNSRGEGRGREQPREPGPGWEPPHRTAVESRLSGGRASGPEQRDRGSPGREPWDRNSRGKAGPAGRGASGRNGTCCRRPREGSWREQPGGWGRPGLEPRERAAASCGPWGGSFYGTGGPRRPELPSQAFDHELVWSLML